MKVQTIHIFGASGSGTTTFGKALASRSGFKFLDTDDYLWKKKYSEINPVPNRIRLIEKEIHDNQKWVLSGSLCGWGDVFISSFNLVVFVYLPKEIRITRLNEREKERYGDNILPEGSRYSEYTALIQWAEKYDTAGLEIRSKLGHEEWIKNLGCPVLRFDGDISVEEKLKQYDTFVRELELETSAC